MDPYCLLNEITRGLWSLIGPFGTSNFVSMFRIASCFSASCGPAFSRYCEKFCGIWLGLQGPCDSSNIVYDSVDWKLLRYNCWFRLRRFFVICRICFSVSNYTDSLIPSFSYSENWESESTDGCCTGQYFCSISLSVKAMLWLVAWLMFMCCPANCDDCDCLLSILFYFATTSDPYLELFDVFVCHLSWLCAGRPSLVGEADACDTILDHMDLACYILRFYLTYFNWLVLYFICPCEGIGEAMLTFESSC